MDTISQAQPARTIRFTSSLVFRNSFTNQWNQLIDHWQDGRYKRSKLARGVFKTRKKKKKFKKRGREGEKKRIALHARWTISKTRNETRCTVERVGTDRRSVVPRARAPDSILNRLSGVPSISNWRDNKFYVPPLGVGRLFPVASPRISSPIKFKRFATPGFPPSSATEGGSGVGAGKEGGGRLLQQRQIAARVFDWYSTNLMAPDGAMDEHLPSRIDEHPRSGSLTLFVRCNDPLSSYVSLFLILFRFFEWEKIERTEVDVCCSLGWKFATFCPVLFM